MAMRAALLMSCGLLLAAPDLASIHDMLAGLDRR
jgi:hypothetical protein